MGGTSKSGEPSPILVALFAIAIACAMDAVIKHVGAQYSPLMVAFARFGFGAVAAGIVYVLAGTPRLSAKAMRAHWLRAVTIVISATAFFYALALLPLVEAVTLGFAAPLMVPLLAMALLKEKLSPTSVAAAVVGFVGVAVAAYSPSGPADSPHHTLGVVAMLISVAAYAFQLILLRSRAAEDGAAAIGLMGNLLPAALIGPPALAFAKLPALADLPWFVLIGALGAGFWLLLIWAYARRPAQTLAPLEYTALIWSTIWGYAAFHEPPRPQVYLGAGFIIAACVLATWDERRRGAPASSVIDAEGPLP